MIQIATVECSGMRHFTLGPSASIFCHCPDISCRHDCILGTVSYHAVCWNASVKKTVKMTSILKYNYIREEISRHGIFVLFFLLTNTYGGGAQSVGAGNPVNSKTV